VAHNEAEMLSEGGLEKGWREKKVKQRGGRDFYRRRKRRLVCACTLPEAADAKPGGDDTTLQIIFILF
jgi:hypothetical protein